MRRYGIETEAEIFTGVFQSIANQQSLNEKDDPSPYNSERVRFLFHRFLQAINEEVRLVFQIIAEDFFEEFGGLDECRNKDKQDKTRGGRILVCTDITKQMHLKASALYKVAYGL